MHNDPHFPDFPISHVCASGDILESANSLYHSHVEWISRLGMPCSVVSQILM